MVDLAEGHVAALNHIERSAKPYCDPINLGTGRGTSVLEMVKVRWGACKPLKSLNLWSTGHRPRHLRPGDGQGAAGPPESF